MPPSARTDRNRAGFTLVELLIAMTLAVAVTGVGFSLFHSQSSFFGTNQQRYDMLQNARGALEDAQRVIRTMGAGVPTGQPVLVYGDNSVLAFNSRLHRGRHGRYALGGLFQRRRRRRTKRSPGTSPTPD